MALITKDFYGILILGKCMNPISELAPTALQDTPIRLGIKTVGVGKRGSKALSPELAQAILSDLQTEKILPVEKGAFFAGLFLKGITPPEKILESALPAGTLQSARNLAQFLAHDVPESIQMICQELLDGKELPLSKALELGRFLFSDLPGDGARGLVATALRVRYETSEEYEGLRLSIQETIERGFRIPTPPGFPIIQLAEPFDGVDQSYLLTPLMAQHLIAHRYRVISLVGRNSGPKSGYNLLDLSSALKGHFPLNNTEITDTQPAFGYFLHQAFLSRPLDHWVNLRRQIIKRPFLATLERFLNPAGARILFTSAFHPPFTEKMITIAERAGFPGAVVIRNGLEGSLAFPLLRPVKIMCSARCQDGTYRRHEFEFDPQALLGHDIHVEEKLSYPDLEENVRLIKVHAHKGRTHNRHFDLRIKATLLGIDQALEWLNKNIANS